MALGAGTGAWRLGAGFPCRENGIVSEGEGVWDKGDGTAPRVRGVPEGVQVAAKEMRRRMTPAEAVLWEALRDRRLGGLKFRWQQVLGACVLGFCCPAARLVVEVDGDFMMTRRSRLTASDGASSLSPSAIVSYASGTRT